MGKFIRFVSLALACAICLILPAQAVVTSETSDTRESAFFSSHLVFLDKTSSNTFQVWFDVVSNVTTMDELGASVIHVYRSADGNTWSKVRSYYKANYPSMICLNTASHVGYVTYTGAWSGYYYRASVTLYAKTGNSVGEKVRYTEIIRM